MFCSHCGASVSTTQNTCPNCGKQVLSQPSSISKWIKALIFIVVGIVAFLIWAVSYTESILSIIDDQLNDIHKNNITQAYYDYSSKEFQKVTSLEQFKEFVKSQPALSENHPFRKDDEQVEGSIIIVSGTFLQNGKDFAKGEYQLTQENDTWKLLNIKISPIETAQEDQGIPSDAATKEALLSVIAQQLTAIKQNNFEVAYSDLSSDEFKKATSIEQFKEFIKSYPILLEETTHTLQSAAIDADGDANVNILLESLQQKIPTQYLLKKEGMQWKIVGLKLTV